MSGSPPPGSSNRLPTWFLLLLAVGGPTAVGLTFAQTITQHPWQALGIALLYEVVVLLVGLMTTVWQHLQSNWGNKIADWINNGLEAVMLGYRKRYCQWFIEQHQRFEAGGLNFYDMPTVDQIFVEPNVTPYQIPSAISKALKIPSPSHHSYNTSTNYPLKDIDTTTRVSRFSLFRYAVNWLHRTRVNDRSAPLQTLSHYLLATQQHLVLLGGPGSGKTTLLKKLGLSLVARKEEHRLPKLPYKLPFFIPLRDCGNTIKEQEQLSLAEAAQIPLRKGSRSAPPGWIEHHLTKSNCLILLDGLDEVPDPETREAVAKWVEQQIITYSRNNRFVLTSRPSGYKENPINGNVTVLEVKEFNYEQIKEFVYKWYKAEKANRSSSIPGGFEDTKQKAEVFLSRLRGTPALFQMARNPLLLNMSIIVHNYRSALPGSRGELYEEICNVLLGKRQSAKGMRLAITPYQSQLVLQPLAFAMMQKGVKEITSAEAQAIIQIPLKSVKRQMTPQSFLEWVENISGLWVKQGTDAYGFAHLSYQEYLAAMHVKQKNLQQTLVNYIGMSWWRETIVLYCNRADASPIIKECLTQEPLTISILQLALDCNETASSIEDPSAQDLFDHILAQGAEDANPEIQKIVEEALLAHDINSMGVLDDELYAATSLINCAEYQLFLNEQRQQDKYYQPDHWADMYFPSGQARDPALGVRPSDARAFCTWLTERDKEDWLYRLPQKSEVSAIEDLVYETGKLLAGTGYWIDNGEGFAWVKGNLLVSGKAIQEAAEYYSSLDSQQALTYQPSDPEDKKEWNLAESLSCARDLAKARSLINQLIVSLRSVRNHIRDQERSLADKLSQASREVNRLDDELKNIQRKEHALENSLLHAKRELTSISEDLKRLEEEEHSINKELVRFEKEEQEHHSKEGSHQLKSNQRTQSSSRYVSDNPHNTSGNKFDLQTRLKNISMEKDKLNSEQNSAQENILSHQAALNDFREKKEDQQIEMQLDIARKHKEDQKNNLDNFRAQTRPFSSEYDRLLAITPLYKRDTVFSRALTRHHELGLGHVLDNINKSSTLEETLIRISTHADNFIQNLIRVYNHYRTDIHANTQDNSESNIIALNTDNLSKIKHITSSSTKLMRTLWSYFDFLTQHRPLGRSKPKARLIRFTIRYVAKELADHLSYWSWKESFSEGEQENNIAQNSQDLDALFDIYVTFSILEARAEGRIPAYEGILIVKEFQQKNV